MAEKKMLTKAEKLAETMEIEAKERTMPLFDLVHKVLLAGVGVVALTTEEAQEFVDRLVERGELAEKDGRKLINEVLQRRNGAEKQVEKRVESASNLVEDQIERILTRLNVPTKNDIDELSNKIGVLSKKVDELKKATE